MRLRLANLKTHACEKMPEKRFLMAMSLLSAFSRMDGKLSRRSVWPVGAVSNTMVEYLSPCTYLWHRVHPMCMEGETNHMMMRKEEA